MKKISFSSIVLAFNSSNTIIETLESIKKQTLKPAQLIINDDKSKDDTVSKVEKWLIKNSKIFKNVSFLKNKSRQGSVKSLKNALQLVENEWVKPMAADDLLDVEYFKKLDNKIKNYNFDIFICNLNFIDEKSQLIELSEQYYFDCIPIFFLYGRFLISYLLKHRMIIPSSTAMFRISVIKEIVDLRFKLIEDWPMWNLIFKNKFKVLYSKDKIFNYRIHTNQVTRSPKDKLTQKWIKQDLENFRLIFSSKTNRKEKLLINIHFIIFFIIKFFYSKNKIKYKPGIIILKTAKLLNKINTAIKNSKKDYILS